MRVLISLVANFVDGGIVEANEFLLFTQGVGGDYISLFDEWDSKPSTNLKAASYLRR